MANGAPFLFSPSFFFLVVVHNVVVHSWKWPPFFPNAGHKIVASPVSPPFFFFPFSPPSASMEGGFHHPSPFLLRGGEAPPIFFSPHLGLVYQTRRRPPLFSPARPAEPIDGDLSLFSPPPLACFPHSGTRGMSKPANLSSPRRERTFSLLLLEKSKLPLKEKPSFSFLRD